jgi:hypothetical protein
VQLLLLTEHRFLVPHSAEKMGYRAEIVPVGKHSVAVIGTSQAAVEQGIELAGRSIEWFD